MIQIVLCKVKIIVSYILGDLYGRINSQRGILFQEDQVEIKKIAKLLRYYYH